MVTSSMSLMSTLFLQIDSVLGVRLYDSGTKNTPGCRDISSPVLDKDSRKRRVGKHKHANTYGMKTHTSCGHMQRMCVFVCVHTHTHPWSELSLYISLLQQENKRAPAAASQQSTFSYIVVTYKELNINTLLCIDWKNTCHYNGLVDISE